MSPINRKIGKEPAPGLSCDSSAKSYARGVKEFWKAKDSVKETASYDDKLIIWQKFHNLNTHVSKKFDHLNRSIQQIQTKIASNQTTLIGRIFNIFLRLILNHRSSELKRVASVQTNLIEMGQSLIRPQFSYTR
jgi:hypothetical protein